MDDFFEPVTSTAPTPAGDHLFTIQQDDKQKLLPKERAQAFHCTTAQLLFLSQQARSDMQILVFFSYKMCEEP